MSFIDKYADRNSGNVLTGMFGDWMNPARKQEAADATEQPKGHHGIPDLSALFSQPVVKAVAPPVSPPVSAPVKKPVSKTELPKCVTGRITHITRCEGGTCTRVKVCE